MGTIQINNRIIGSGYPVYIIAEMSANHGGSLERAKEIIYAAKESGADCVKLQTYTADTLTIDCDNDFFTLKSGLWKGETLYKLYKKAYTPWEWHEELFDLAGNIGIDIMSTPFDKTAVDFLEKIGISAYKISSFELVDTPLLKYTAQTKKPMIISTGMATFDEILEAYQCVGETKNQQIAFLKCISSYPASVNDMNLKTIHDMIERFQIPIGLSDHSMGSLAPVIAVSLGASIIEKHFCLSRNIETPDSSFSMEPEEFKNMTLAIRDTEKAIGVAEYGALSQEKDNLKNRKSIFAVKDIKKGELFTDENIKVIRPGYGMEPKYYEHTLGKTSSCDIAYGTSLNKEMIRINHEEINCFKVDTTASFETY